MPNAREPTPGLDRQGSMRGVLREGVTADTRSRRLDETLNVLQGLLGRQTVSHRGSLLEVDMADSSPMLPLLIGVNAEAVVHHTELFGDDWP